MILFLISLAATDSALGLGLLLLFYKIRRHLTVDHFNLLKN